MPSHTGAMAFIAWSRSLPDAEERKQDADAEIEAVHHDIGRDPEGDDEGPDDGEVDQRRSSSPLRDIDGDGVIPAVRIGSCAGSDSPGCGGCDISLRMYQMPKPNTAK